MTTTMDADAACWQNCAAVAGTMWTVVALFIATVIFLIAYYFYNARRQKQIFEKKTLPPLTTAEENDKEDAEKKGRERRLQALEDADLEDPIRMKETAKEIEAMATLSSAYRKGSTKRRFLSKKIICNTVAEVSRRHTDLKITAVFAGSMQEGFGDTLQPIQYLQASNKSKGSHDVESGSVCYKYAKRPIFSSDVDVMIVPLAPCICPNGDLEYEHVLSKPLSFVKLKPTVNGTLGDLQDCLTDGGYLSAKAAKKLLQEALEHSTYVYCGPSVTVAVEEHGAAVEMKWAEPSVDGEFCETVLIADFTFALHIPEWPRCALDWTERARNWPSRLLTAAITASGCHVVAFYRDSSDDECHWRLSFSRAELILFSAIPPYARDMYISLKALFKSTIQPHCPSLSSYHLKTIVLWIVEQAPCDFFSSSDSTAVALIRTLGLLRDSVRDGVIPHYFVSGHNILPFVSELEVKSATDAILDVTLYAVFHLNRLRTFEARYFDAKDYLLVSLPEESHQPKSSVQALIQRQLKKAMSAIPDAFEGIPLSVPDEPVFVHLLTGKVVVLSRLDVAQEACANEYNEIITAVVQDQDNVMVAKSAWWRRLIKGIMLNIFFHKLDRGLIYITEHSLVNTSRFAKKVTVNCTVLILFFVVMGAITCTLPGGIYTTLSYCVCQGASGGSTGAYSSLSSNAYSGRGDSPFYNVKYNGVGAVSSLAIDGTAKGGTKTIDDVSHGSLTNKANGGKIVG